VLDTVDIMKVLLPCGDIRASAAALRELPVMPIIVVAVARSARRLPTSVLMPTTTPLSPVPTAITLHQQSKALEITYSDGKSFRLPCEFLRVYSPSAEVRGHGPGQEVLQTGKRQVEIVRIEPVGNYAVQFVYSDGHDTGIYSWDLLYEYGMKQQAMWAAYLDRLAQAGASRDHGDASA